MKNKLICIYIVLLWGCNTLMEQTSPLEGDFFIQDGWLAFTSRNYDEADKHFNTAIETDDSGSLVHFLSYVGLGWTQIYKAHSIKETSENGLVKSAGENFDFALNILSESIENLPESRDIDNLYAGFALQRTYFAKQKAANGIEWETTNLALSDTVRMLYQESIEFSNELKSDFVFKHDFNLNFIDILLLRTENYLILGNVDKAIATFHQLDFEEFDFEITSACKQGVNADMIVECLCIVINNGICPLVQE